jgi:UDP-2,3-diacylglucosamine pyrophosphatase LpxH
LVLSDLHFADTVERRTIDARALCNVVEDCAERAQGLPGKSLQVLLLGDIFEILKSQVWLDAGIRPWQAPPLAASQDFEIAVENIFDRIVRCNTDFFERWKQLTERLPGLSAVYVPGNHDWPLNHAMGLAARRKLVNVLQLKHDPKDPFPVSFLDHDHGVLATHGHEHDIFNRTQPGKIAFGDAVVIEVLLTLPALVAKHLSGVSPSDPSLEFLHELDNVRPQSGTAMAAWIMQGAKRLEAEFPDARHAVEQAVAEVVSRMRVLRRSRNTTGAWRRGDKWVSALAGAGTIATKLGWLLHRLGRGGPGNESESYVRAAAGSLASIDSAGGAPIEFYICGHTHLPEHVAVGQRVGTGEAAVPMFLNTGTWRRVQRYVHTDRSAPRFVTYDEECFVVVHSHSERTSGKPSYEFRRVARRYP